MGNYIKFIHKKLSFLIVMAYNESVHNASPSHLHRVTRLLTPAEENKFVTRDSVSLGIVRLLRHYFLVHGGKCRSECRKVETSYVETVVNRGPPVYI